MRVGVIGTGVMGRPIAVNCLTAGHSVIVYNRTRARKTSAQQGELLFTTFLVSTARADER